MLRTSLGRGRHIPVHGDRTLDKHVHVAPSVVREGEIVHGPATVTRRLPEPDGIHLGQFAVYRDNVDVEVIEDVTTSPALYRLRGSITGSW